MCKSVSSIFRGWKHTRTESCITAARYETTMKKGVFFDNGYQISCMLYIYIYYVVSVKALLAPDRAFNWLRFFSAIWVTKRKGMPEMYDVTVPRWFNTFACSPAHSLHDAFTFYYGHSPVWFPILNESYPHDAHIRVYVRSVKCLRDSVLAGGGGGSKNDISERWCQVFLGEIRVIPW